MTTDGTPRLSPLGQAALNYARRGWPVFPLHNPTSHGCSCGSRECSRVGKHPRTEHGLKEATTNEETIRSEWTQSPEANIATATGKLMVIEIDGQEGEAPLAELEAKHGSIVSRDSDPHREPGRAPLRSSRTGDLRPRGQG